MHSLQLVQNACKYVLAQKMETMEDIFHVVSVGILYKEICKVGIFFPVGIAGPQGDVAVCRCLPMHL